VFETPAVAFLSQKKTRKASPVPGTFSRVASSTGNPDVVSAGRENGADMKRNATITPSQETPADSQVLTGLISKHSVNPTEISDKSEKKDVIEKLNGSTRTESLSFQCKTAISQG
jgi:hypothetical protein